MFRATSKSVFRKSRKSALNINKKYGTETTVPSSADVIIIGMCTTKIIKILFIILYYRLLELLL